LQNTLVIGSVTILPLFFLEAPLVGAIILISLFVLCNGFIIWANFTIQYIFEEEVLFIKSGPIKSRIPYKNITKVVPTKAIFTGYKVLSSRDAIEIFDQTTFMGSVKISPENQKAFISELKKRAPHIQIDETLAN
jgi:hypothetical protein